VRGGEDARRRGARERVGGVATIGVDAVDESVDGWGATRGG